MHTPSDIATQLILLHENLLDLWFEEAKCTNGIIVSRKAIYETALALGEYKISEDEIKKILLASYLHYVDNKYYFPTHTKFENTRYILDIHKFDNLEQDLIIRMIRCSSYDDSRPDWFYIPMYVCKPKTTLQIKNSYLEKEKK